MEGYDAKFDPPLEKRLECPICLLAQREPMQTPCGHRFCSACILRALREMGPRCPVDNTTVCIHQLFKDNFAKREVLSLNVHCSADGDGCSWQGELRELQSHSKQCDLVLITCPNTCGHSCQRKLLHDHLPQCTNRPQQCSTCNICFPRSSLATHQPLCSHILLPDTVTSVIDKAGEILKWVGYLKLKLNGQVSQLTGYLTAPGDSEQAYLPTSSWSSNITLITLNSLASQIFSRMLTSSEVEPVVLNFALVTNDTRSAAFQKIFRKKPEICNAAVCLRLKPSTSRRETGELTIMYLCWCEQRKMLQAYIANLKTHLVRQIQTHLQDIQGSRRHRRVRSHPSQYRSHGDPAQPRPLGPAYHHTAHQRSRSHPIHQATPPAPPTAAQRAAAAAAPQPMINLRHIPPPQVVAAAAAGNTPTILPNLLSWQMSQSFNMYPWRMQAAGVPFFTFPATPPSYIPANSYPYTFAPLPAAPFSISPIQPVPTTVHVPPYNGLSVVVPQVTTVDANAPAMPINGNQGNVVTQGYPVVTGTGSQPLEPDFQTVAVTIGDQEGQVVHVIQQPTMSRGNGRHQDHQLHSFHHHAAAAPPPALIPTDHTHLHHHTLPHLTTPLTTPLSTPSHGENSLYESRPNSLGLSEASPLTFHRLPPQQSVSSRQQQQLTAVVEPDMGGRGPFRQIGVPEPEWDEVPGPSGLNGAGTSPPDLDVSISSRDSTPESSSLFSHDEDSDSSHLPEISVSPHLFDDGMVGGASDHDDGSSADQTPHDVSTDDSETNSALHTLADAAAVLADSPDPTRDSAHTSMASVATATAPGPAQVVRVPVLINISDSESDSRPSPSSIIDLTHSPNTSSNRPSTTAIPVPPPTLAPVTTPYNYNMIVPGDGPGGNSAPPTQRHQVSSHSANSHTAQSGGIHGDGRISAVLVPVIHHHWNGHNEQGLHPIPPFVPGDQMGVVQAASVPIDNAPPHVLQPSAPNISTDILPPPQPGVDLPSVGYPVQHDYSNPVRTPLAGTWQQDMAQRGRHATMQPTAATLLYPASAGAPDNSSGMGSAAPGQQSGVGLTAAARGDFWNTVIPSLDMSLQSSTTSTSEP